MRLVSTLALVVAGNIVPLVRAVAPAAVPATVQAHVAINGLGEFAAAVSTSGAPTSLRARFGADESVELRIQFYDEGRLGYEVRRAGGRPFHLTGAITPPHQPFTIGCDPVDVQLWLTDH